MREDNLLCVVKRKFVAHHRLGARLAGLSESGPFAEPDRRELAVGGGHYVHPAGRRVRVLLHLHRQEVSPLESIHDWA